MNTLSMIQKKILSHIKTNIIMLSNNGDGVEGWETRAVTAGHSWRGVNRVVCVKRRVVSRSRCRLIHETAKSCVDTTCTGNPGTLETV